MILHCARRPFTLLLLVVVAVLLSLPSTADTARILSSVHLRRGPSSSQPTPSQSKLISSISKALDESGSGIGIPSVDQIIRSTSTLGSSTPSSLSSPSASGTPPPPPPPSSHKGGKHPKRKKPNKVTVISNLNVMQHNEQPPERADLVALSEQNSKTQQEHRRKQMDAENRDIRREEANKLEHSINEQDTKADVADSNAESAAQNRQASDEANNKHTSVLSAEQAQKNSMQNFNEMNVKQKSQQDEQTAKSEASNKMMAQATAEQKSKAEQLLKANAETASKAQQEAKTKAEEAAAKKKQADEQAEKTAQEQKDKLKYVINAGPMQPTQSFILAQASSVATVTQWGYMFWIKPLSSSNSWTSVLHHGASDSERNPAVFMYPGTSRLHIRSGSKENWNGGFDLTNALPMNAWSHLGLLHSTAGFSVFLNGVLLGQDNNSGPLQKEANLYCSNPWYAAAPVQLADIRYFNRFVQPNEVQLVFQANKHP